MEKVAPFVGVVMLVHLLAYAVLTLMAGEPGYSNYWGGYVDALTVIVTCVLAAFVFGKLFFDEKFKPKSRAARKRARREERRAKRKQKSCDAECGGWI